MAIIYAEATEDRFMQRDSKSPSKPTFLKKESEAYEITSLSVCLSVCPIVRLSVSVCVSPPNNAEQIGRFV
jgi:hypothetical protein